MAARGVDAGGSGARLRRARLARGAAAVLIVLALPLAAAQDPGTQARPGTALYSNEQLDQMLAPIALYPDELLGPLLVACTYPLEIVQADRWLQDPGHAALRGDALAQALQAQPWDESVKAMVAFPQVLSALDNNLEWAEQVGDAFLAQGSAVMDRVQQLRGRAQAARTLNSGPQQMVSGPPQQIGIHPPGDDVLYVPEYDPNVVYGPWPYPDEPPADFELPDYVPGGFIAFPIVVPLWFATSWDWPGHQLGVGAAPPGPGPQRGGVRPLPGHGPARRFVPWHFDALHRHGVPLRAGAPANVPLPAALLDAGANDYRGYAPVAGATGAAGPAQAPVLHGAPPRPAPIEAPARRELPREPTPPELRPAPPAFESFGHGGPVRQQEQRGASSRMSSPAPSNRERR